MNIHHHNDITALILAGGKARRMHGEDKGLVLFQARPMIEHILAAITPQAGAVLINANRNRDRYQAYGHPVIHDDLADFQGPLAGFAAGLQATATDDLVTLPCDAPFVPADIISRLKKAREDKNAEIAVAHDGERIQPVYALLHKDLIPSLHAFLASGDRKISRWYRQHNTALADFSDCRPCFTNINTLEERSELEQRIHSGELKAQNP